MDNIIKLLTIYEIIKGPAEPTTGSEPFIYHTDKSIEDIERVIESYINKINYINKLEKSL